MIDHLGLSVADLARSTEFYLKALEPLGYGIVMEVSAEQTGHAAALGFGVPGGNPEDFQSGKPSFWIGGDGGVSPPIHVAFVARTRRRSTPSIAPLSPRAARTTARRASARIITRTITPPSCSIPTATISRPSPTRLRSELPQGEAETNPTPLKLIQRRQRTASGPPASIGHGGYIKGGFE